MTHRVRESMIGRWEILRLRLRMTNTYLACHSEEHCDEESPTFRITKKQTACGSLLSNFDPHALFSEARKTASGRMSFGVTRTGSVLFPQSGNIWFAPVFEPVRADCHRQSAFQFRFPCFVSEARKMTSGRMSFLVTRTGSVLFLLCRNIWFAPVFEPVRADCHRQSAF